MTEQSQDGQPLLSKHRIEALVDGIFAVAMTLLVIDLRLPERAHLTSEAVLQHALLDLVPNLMSWLISFFVLAIFWIANHRLYSHVRHPDQGLLWLTILNLAGAALLPFASAVSAQFPSFTAQLIYSGVMILMGVSTFLIARHIYRHPALCAHPMPEGAYRAVLGRSCGAMTIAALAALASFYKPGMSNAVFMLMFTLRPIGMRIERRHVAKALREAQAKEAQARETQAQEADAA
jgi:uncharacterized membrane protein